MNMYVRKSGIEEQVVGSTKVLFFVESFKFFELNETMGLLWDYLAKPRSQDELVLYMSKEYGSIKKSIIVKDVNDALLLFEKESLLEE